MLPSFLVLNVRSLRDPNIAGSLFRRTGEGKSRRRRWRRGGGKFNRKPFESERSRGVKIFDDKIICVRIKSDGILCLNHDMTHEICLLASTFDVGIKLVEDTRTHRNK